MHPLILAAVFILVLASLALTDTTHCTTREDAQAQRWVTTCMHGSRVATTYDAQAQRWRTDIMRAPKGDKVPGGWPVPGKLPR
jgi:hypothetical protein